MFGNTGANSYFIDDRRLVTEIQSKPTKKGNYNLFTAFSVEYIDIIRGLLDDKKISSATFEYIKKEKLPWTKDSFLAAFRKERTKFQKTMGDESTYQ